MNMSEDESSRYVIEKLEDKIKQQKKIIRELKKQNTILSNEHSTTNDTKHLINCVKSANRDIKNAYKNGKLDEKFIAKQIIKDLLDTQYLLDPYRDIFRERIERAEKYLRGK